MSKEAQSEGREASYFGTINIDRQEVLRKPGVNEMGEDYDAMDGFLRELAGIQQVRGVAIFDGEKPHYLVLYEGTLDPTNTELKAKLSDFLNASVVLNCQIGSHALAIDDIKQGTFVENETRIRLGWAEQKDAKLQAFLRFQDIQTQAA